MKKLGARLDLYQTSPANSVKLLSMGWLRLVGSLKLQVSFAKEPYKRDDILQKRPIILLILLTVAIPSFQDIVSYD